MISIHTALAGCDEEAPAIMVEKQIFQSTQPSQAVTIQDVVCQQADFISIHTALAGCDRAAPEG